MDSTTAPTIELVIFDFDGTLVQFPHDYLFAEASRILAALNHPPIEEAALWEHFSDFDFFGFVQHPSPEEFIEQFWTAFDWPNYPRGVPVAAALRSLAEVKALGKRTAIATARLCSTEQLNADLEHCGFFPLIDAVTTRTSNDTHWKDKSGHIAQLCEKFGLMPSQTMLVGDVPADILSAKAAGVGYTVAVRSGGIKDAVLLATSPDRLIDDVGQIVDVIREFESSRALSEH